MAALLISALVAPAASSAAPAQLGSGIPYERFMAFPSLDGLQGKGDDHHPFTHTRTDQVGRFVAFHSESSFLVPGDLNGQPDVFVRDLSDNSIELVSRSMDGNAAGGDSSFPDISSDGRYLVFHSKADDLVDGDDNNAWDVFLLDREEDDITLVSHTPEGGSADGDSFTGTVSDDGRYVAFTSWANDLTDDPAEAVARIYVADMVNDTVSLLVSPPSGGFGAPSFVPDISADGRYVTFESLSDRLVVNDNNQSWDVYVADWAGADLSDTESTGGLTLISNGSGSTLGSFRPRISSTGRYIAFESYSDSLVPGDSNGVVDVFRWDNVGNSMVRVSHSAPSLSPVAGATAASISGDGSVIAFQTDSDGEAVSDINGLRDTYTVNLGTDDVTWTSDPARTGGGSNDPSFPSISGDGSSIAFESRTPKGNPNRKDDDDWDPFVVTLGAAGGTVAAVGVTSSIETPGDAYLFGSSGAARFDDVGAGGFSDSGIGFLAINGITQGISYRKYGPDATLTRAQLVVMLHRLAGSPASAPQSVFADVPRASWYALAVDWATSRGIVKGLPGNVFGPDQPATRAQVVVMLGRMSRDDLGGLRPAPFGDVERGSWYADAVDWAFTTGIARGTAPDRFSPRAVTTRAQAAAFIERFSTMSGWLPSR